ncbi:hypothetical protein AAC387_Pa05g0266 [Persea americana]
MDGEEEVDDLFSRLPEGCISHILSFTSPRDTCRLSAVSRLFHSASESEHIWEGFVQSGCSGILERSDFSFWEELQQISSNKELFFRLCYPILIDYGTMSFSMDKMTGKRCFMLSATELPVYCIELPESCAWPSFYGSRFPVLLTLWKVGWLRIEGKINTCMLSSKTTYRAYFVFGMTRGCRYDFQHSEISIKLGSFTSNHCSEVPDSARCWLWDVWHDWVPQRRSDGWMEIVIGDFFVDEAVEGEVLMSLIMAAGGYMETLFGVEGIDIRPLF